MLIIGQQAIGQAMKWVKWNGINNHHHAENPKIPDNATESRRVDESTHGRKSIRTHWRQLSGVCLLGLTASVFTLINVRKAATEAYITSDIIQIRSPLQGTVAEEPIGTGEMFIQGEILVQVLASREEESRQDSIRLEIERINSNITATESQLASLAVANNTRLRDSIATEEKELKNLEGMERRYRLQAHRYRQLVKIGAIDPESLAGAEAAHNSYAQRRMNSKRILDGLSKELADAEAKRRGGVNQLPRPSRRLEILEIRIVELNQQLKELQARRHEAMKRSKNTQKQRDFTYRPWFNGIVLSNRIAKGSEVNRNEALMTIANCNRVKVEALFEAGKINNKAVGDAVQITSRRDKKGFKGSIVSMRGVKAIRPLEGPEAASFKQTNEDWMRVQISVPKEFKRRECRLGERVEVTL